VPVDRQVNFTVQSKDVLHDFWVPAFRMKIDAVRGIDTHIRVTPDRIGRYPVVCAELCGIGHSVMRQTAHVVSAQDFDTWLQERAERRENGGAGGEEAEGGEAAAADGAEIFSSAGCGNCHTLAEANAQGNVGPNLDDELADKDEAFIRKSIVDPNAEVAGGFTAGIMPLDYEQTLEPAEIDALVEYLANVTQG
jgi:cytochrome c oxidase subunit 2